MLVVHGGWVPGTHGPGRLSLWAEDSGLPLSTTSRARRRAHPFAVPAATLAATLTSSADDVRDALAKAVEGELTLRLPGTARGPLPSPETGSETPGREIRLTEWETPVLLVPPDAALAALGALADPDPDGPWAAAASLRYLCVLAGHACDLSRRGRILPQVVVEAGEPAARWRPVLTGGDAAAWRDFAEAMPPVCRAATADGVSRTLRDALEVLVDAGARAVMPERLMVGHRPGPKAALADRMVLALTAADPALPGARPAEVTELRGALDDWMRAANEANGPVRVSFRLIEPAPGEDEWGLEFALQSAEDPSLYLRAEDLWAGGRMPGLPHRPDEMLLAGLGRAVRLFPLLHVALLDAEPAEMTLDTGEAHEFLRQAAPLLQAAGFGVQLPKWAGRKGVGLKLTTRSRTKSSSSRAMADSGVGLDQLVDFRIDLIVGDGAVTAAELAELARLKVPLVRIRGQWVELDDRQLKAALKAVGRRREGELTAGEVLQQVGGRRRRGPAAGRGGRRRDARRPAVRRGRAADADRNTRGVPRDAPAVPGAGFVVVALPRPARPGRHPGRRHGPRQDRADPVAAARRACRPGRGRSADAAHLPDVAGQQLAERGQPVRARACGSMCTTAGRASARMSSSKRSRRPTW